MRESKEVGKMNMSYMMRCVLECINKVIPEIDFVALLKMGAPVSSVEIGSPCEHYLSGVHSCAKPVVLWCKSVTCPRAWHTSLIH